MSIYEDLEPWRDEKRFIVQNKKYGGDAGDTANRMGMMLTFLGACAHTDYNQNHYTWPEVFIHETGQIIRHPHGKQEWTRELNRSSRDQATPWIAGLTIWRGAHVHGVSFQAALSRIASAVMKNGSRFHNYLHNGSNRAKRWWEVDVAGPEIWALFIRGLDLKYLKWLLPILDLETLVGTAIWNRRGGSPNNDIPQHLAVLKASNEVSPSITSKLALKWLNKDLAVLKCKEYYDFPGYSAEPEKDQVPIGEAIIEWLNAQR